MVLVLLAAVVGTRVVAGVFQKHRVATKDGFVDPEGHGLVTEGSFRSKEFRHLPGREGKKQIIVPAPVAAAIVPVAFEFVVIVVVLHVFVVIPIDDAVIVIGVGIGIGHSAAVLVLVFFDRRLRGRIPGQHPSPGALLIDNQGYA